MSYQLYRNTTLGNTLQESLDELIQVRLTKFPAMAVADTQHLLLLQRRKNLSINFHICFWLFQYGQITPQLAFKVLLQFDKCINSALSQRVKARVTFKANKLNTYRFCDNVWTLMLNDVEFREVHEFAKVDKVKIVACDGKSKFGFPQNWVGFSQAPPFFQML